MDAMSDWSGEVRVSSLPYEVQARRGMNARLLENAVRTPNVRIGESATSRVAGMPVRVQEMVGGATAVTVDSLSMIQRMPPPASSGPIVSGDGGSDPYAGMSRNEFNRGRFIEFFNETVGRRAPIREAHGPKAGYLGAIGIDSDWPHKRGRMTSLGYGPRPGFPSPFSGREKVRSADDPDGRRMHTDDFDTDMADHPGRSCYQVHSGQTHSDWAGQEEEEERAKRHAGISCERVHGLIAHHEWVDFFSRLGR